MKTIRNSLAFLAIVSLLFLPLGCQTQNAAGKTISTVAVTVDGAMQGWAVWVVKGNTTQEQQAKVNSAYEKYQTAMAATSKVYAVVANNPDQSALTLALVSLDACKSELLALIAQFTK
jgi:hypothetical protein